MSNEQKYYDALKRIANYDSPETLRDTAEKELGLEPEEAIEMAYENVIAEAIGALGNDKRPK